MLDDNGTRRNEKEITVDAIFVEGANFSRHLHPLLIAKRQKSRDLFNRLGFYRC
jgi:hypothetical protein